jgi:phosphohistidine phosphatase
LKRLTLVRHANAEWKDARMTDFQRPLNRKGQKEAEATARRLLELEWVPELLIASPAERTRQTAEILARDLGAKRVQFEERLYLARAEEILRLIRGTGPLVNHLMIVGHNPGISELARRLSNGSLTHELSTGAACLLRFNGEDWSALGPAETSLAHHEVPTTGMFRQLFV